MKILMTSETFQPLMGGAEMHILNMITQLKSNGFDVILFTNTIGETKNDKENGIIRIPWHKKNLFKICKILWKESKDADIIHSHYSYRLAMLASIIAKIRRKPMVVTLHGMGILNHPNTHFVYQVAHSFYRYIALKFCTHIISTSDDLAQFAYKYVNKDKISIISNGFDDKVFNKDIKVSKALISKYKNNKIILTVRRLVPKNGIHYLIETIPYIIKKIPNIKYIIIGDGNMRGYIESRISDLNISEYVGIFGEVPNENVPEYLKISDGVVFPSTAESSSLACAEAMATGCNIIASRVGGLVELLGENEERGRLVKLVDGQDSNYNAPMQLKKENYQHFSDIIVDSILSTSEQRKKVALKYAHNNLTWEVIVHKTIKIYNNILNAVFS